MNHDLSVSQSIAIQAPAAAVWEVMTKPTHIAVYLHGTETITDWQVGSSIIFQGEYNGQHYRDKGIVRENVPHVRLVYGYWTGFSGLEDRPENYSTVSYDIAPGEDGEVVFTWTQEGFVGTEGLEHSKAGFAAMLQQIKTLAESI